MPAPFHDRPRGVVAKRNVHKACDDHAADPYQVLTDIQHQPITDAKADETLAGHKVSVKIAACDFDKPCDMDHAPSTETTMGGTKDELVLDLPPTFQARCAAQ
jgi:hypothetical protein